MRNHTCPKRYSCYSYNHTDCDGCNDANTWYGPKPEKKVLLVGMTCKRGALAFMDVVLRQMSNRSIDVVFIDHDKVRFETTHTKVWFIWPDRVCYWLDGIRADGIFGEPYEELRCRAKPDAVISSRDHIGLVDYICQIEREAAESKKIWITTAGDLSPFYRHMMNSLYGKFPEQPGYYLNANRSIVPKMAFMLGRRNGKSAMCAEWVQAVFDEAVKNGTVKTSLSKTEYMSKEDIEQILKQGADHLIQQKLYAALMKGENTMPTREERNYIHQDVESLMSAIMRNASTPKSKLPGIKTVHFSGPVTAVIWEDKTKTIVRCKDGEEPDYEKGLAMAIAKKALGTNKSGSNYYDIFKKWLPKPEVEESVEEENQDG